jgi:hypothetical protein
MHNPLLGYWRECKKDCSVAGYDFKAGQTVISLGISQVRRCVKVIINLTDPISRSTSILNIIHARESFCPIAGL